MHAFRFAADCGPGASRRFERTRQPCSRQRPRLWQPFSLCSLQLQPRKRNHLNFGCSSDSPLAFEHFLVFAVPRGSPSLLGFNFLSVPSPFFPGILLFKKPSNTQGKQPVLKGAMVEKSGESTARSFLNRNNPGCQRCSVSASLSGPRRPKANFNRRAREEENIQLTQTGPLVSCR